MLSIVTSISRSRRRNVGLVKIRLRLTSSPIPPSGSDQTLSPTKRERQSYSTLTPEVRPMVRSPARDPHSRSPATRTFYLNAITGSSEGSASVSFPRGSYLLNRGEWETLHG